MSEGRHSITAIIMMGRMPRTPGSKANRRTSPLSGDYLPEHAAPADRDQYPTPFFGRYYLTRGDQ